MLGEIAGVLGIGSAVQGLLGNEFESDEADAARNFSAQQATVNREFQERMSSTAYQRAVQDMKAAGLNPMLAYQQGGASTPQGSAAATLKGNAANPSPVQMQAAAQIANTEAQTENIKADTVNKKAQVIDRNEEGEIVGLPKTYQARLEQHMGDKAWYEAKTALEKVSLTQAEEAYIRQRIINAITENEIDKLNIPRLINEARAQESSYMKHIAPYTGEAGKLIHSAAEAHEAFRGRTYRRR